MTAQSRALNTAGWLRLKLLFDEALELAPGERRAWLDRLPPGDAHLRAELEVLLATDEAAEGLLDMLGAEERIGQRVGAYRLVGLVGRGGMGSVYRAVRDDDQFEQVVALKLLRFSDAEPSLRQRFQVERQILARLEHPNVARLLDGGSAGGQPYFVMEYVEGQTLERYCADQRLGVRARVALFLDVCGAVQYAHQNLVVHRDLKPGNILVTQDGRPKLLDFGIAKLLELPAGDSLATATLWQPMTPEYASPEQASGGPISTATDVYSLGVLLYELLAGCRPHALDGLAPDELQRVICSVVPPAPSTVVAGLERQDGPEAADSSRGTPGATLPEPPERWSRQLRGDLDTIVLMALRKEPQRRYASAEALAEDLRRFLDGRPVRARRDTWAYRSGKFLGRNRWPVASALLLALSLSGGVAATVWQKRRAERRFEDLRGLARTFIFEVHDAVSALPGSTGARALIVSTGVQYLDRLARDAGDDGALLDELAHGYERLGDVAGGSGQPNRGDHGAALASYEKALELRRGLHANARSASSAKALARLLNSIGLAHVASGNKTAALDRLNEALALATARDPADARLLARELTSTHGALGAMSMRAGRSEEAIAHLGSAVELAQAELQRSPDDPAILTLAAKPATDLALVLQRAGRVDEAERAHDVAARMWAALRARQPGQRAHRRGQALALSNRATFHELKGELAESVRLAQAALGQLDDLAALDAADTNARRDVLLCNVRLANSATTAGQFETAIAAARRAVALGDALLAVMPDHAGADRDTFLANSTLAETLEDAGRSREAVPIRRRSLAWAEARLKRLPDHAYSPLDVAFARYGLGKALLRSGRPAEALEHLGASRSLYAELSRKDAGSLDASVRLLDSVELLGDAHVALATRTGAASPHHALGRSAYTQALELLEGLRARQALTPPLIAKRTQLERLLESPAPPRARRGSEKRP